MSDLQKRNAGEAAAQCVEAGMVVGLGTGSASRASTSHKDADGDGILMYMQLMLHHARQNGAPNPEWRPKDHSNPYFTFDPSKCIVCSRCVRACDEVQGTFALTISGLFDGSLSAAVGDGQ